VVKKIANNPHFTFISEAEGYVVVDKPAPLKVHPSTPDGITTLYDELRQALAYELANGGQISIINRLDRETSGVTLVATTAAMARQFGLSMMEHRFSKTYTAICFGWPEWDNYQHSGPLLRRGEVQPSEIYVKQIVHPQGAPSHTEFTVLHRTQHPTTGQPLTVIQAKPTTGRMHQIRVHLSDLGHPIVGDKLYGFDERCYLDFIQTGWTPELQAKLLLPRQALHASQLELADFGSWHAPLPHELAALCPH
jgi:23S rRNA pseudouridine1911/1915/1917 synthase